MAIDGAKFYEILWDDAASNDGWIDTSTIDTSPVRVISRGWIIAETPTYITIAAAMHCSGTTVGSTQTIPLGMIVSKRELKVSTANAKRKPRHKLHPEPGAEEIHREPSEGGSIQQSNG